MKNTVVVGVSALVVVVVGTWGLLKPPASHSLQTARTSNQTSAADEREYTCPMHPTVTADHPGACPVCGMSLVKQGLELNDAAGVAAHLKAVSLSPRQRGLANVTTTPVERRAMTRTTRSVGIVSYAESKYAFISMRFPGRIEKLYLSFTGQSVRKGDPIADVYSTDAILEQQKYLVALNTYRDPSERAREHPSYYPKSAIIMKEEMLQLGFTEQQISDLEKNRDVPQLITIYSPIGGTVVKKSVDVQRYVETGEPLFEVADLSSVWVLLDVYEKDLRFVSVGQTVKVATPAYPAEEFRGRVTFIDPVLSPDTRTIRVRTEFPNKNGKLKPNMYVNATIAGSPVNVLAVPTSAILPMGTRSIVWVEVGENMFEPREIVGGAVCDGFTEILDGVKQGESVATTGGFLIDAESALTSYDQTDSHGG